MAKRIYFKNDSLGSTSNPPSGFSLIGFDGETLATKNSSGEVSSLQSNAQSNAFITLTDQSTITWNYSNGMNAKVTLGGNRSLNITGATNGDYGTLFVIQDGSVQRRIDFGANDNFASATYSFSSGTSSVDIYTFVYDGSQFYWNFNKNFN